MKSYPSIDKQIVDVDIYAFDKLDGSNIRAEWTRKAKAFVKFGSRNRLLGTDQGKISEAGPIIVDKFLQPLNEIFLSERYERAIAFFEFHGPNSFAGNHPDDISQMTATLIDVAPFKKGILPPREFLDLFGGVDIPDLLYRGKANHPFVDSVKQSTLPNMTFEGVVCKGPYDRKTGMPTMFKVKSHAWLNKLRDYCGNDAALYRMLE